ncbi:MAG: carbohydrate ABC transporter permease [Planctomycetota bacterium]|nr:carbohydrate ABC transporter permease [Planctomycetota bacterium]
MNKSSSQWKLLTLLSVSALFLLPLLLMLLASVKPGEQLTSDPYSLVPQSLRLQNYQEALQSIPYMKYLANSIVLCVGSVIGTLLSCSLVAYGFARIKWRGRNVMFAVLIGTMLLPWHVTMIPRFVLFSELGLYNHLAAIILPTMLGDAFYIFLLRQFFLSIPEEISEAARLDGLSEFGIYWRIILPLSRPALITVALFQLVASWNDFSGPLLYLSDHEKFPLAYGLEQFVSSYADQTHLLMAASVMFTLPMVILFFFAQKSFTRGITMTGSK